jgi:hypothetical protein
MLRVCKIFHVTKRHLKIERKEGGGGHSRKWEKQARKGE